ncbi:hypothetical protein [Galbibacter pacificus]|uniref:Uncharacterized protein n=1 Tax=Galbibacter pacificus TaxID=2996052 RepID=A0ABT6FQJ8_9FLAO|nr:hypothetical protein [Galbibacter pacificus]MDG3581985.1 hypothetical protein [Galbibacter pacificus]MDG3585541.1 hypothetical protein [Galbibacter pacificus]
MNEYKIIELLFYVLPAVVTGAIAYYFFSLHTKNEEGRRRYLLHRETEKTALPLRLQAYERMALFLERINPSKLLLRVAPESADKNQYEGLLIASIESEFDHNLAQQIYITDECWNVIKTSKNATIQLIRKAGMNAENANKLREEVLNELMEKQAPSYTALGYIKKEIRELIG